MSHVNKHTRKGLSLTAPNKEKPIFEKTLKAKELFCITFLEPDFNSRPDEEWVVQCYGYLKRSHLALAENLKTYFCHKCDSEIYDWANPAVKKTVLTLLGNGQISRFLCLILMSMTRLCVISLSLLFHIAIFNKLHLYLSNY